MSRLHVHLQQLRQHPRPGGLLRLLHPAAHLACTSAASCSGAVWDASCAAGVAVAAACSAIAAAAVVSAQRGRAALLQASSLDQMHDDGGATRHDRAAADRGSRADLFRGCCHSMSQLRAALSIPQVSFETPAPSARPTSAGGAWRSSKHAAS